MHHFLLLARRTLPCTLLPLLAIAPSMACQRLSPSDQVLDDNRTIPNLDLPDRYFAGTGGYLASAYRCPAGVSEFVINAPLAGLTYVRDIVYDGNTYAAYGFSDRSPLIGMLYQMSDGSPHTIRVGTAQTVRSPSRPAEGSVNAGVIIRYFLRGGAMQSVPYQHLGSVEAWPVADPTQRLQTPISLGFNVPPVTCALTDHTLVLDEVIANELASPGDSAKGVDFDVVMACPSANVDVSFTMADANDPANTGSLLAPAAGSDATGVQVQILRGAVPLSFGQAWSHGWSAKGSQPIGFHARYLRTSEALAPGAIIGEAVLTATYR